MAGIKGVQGNVTINAGGAPAPSPLHGFFTGLQIAFSLIGVTHARLVWSASVPSGSQAALSSTSALEVFATPDANGAWFVFCEGQDEAGNTEAVYQLPLIVDEKAPTKYAGPIQPALVQRSQVETPPAGRILLCDVDEAGRATLARPDGGFSLAAEVIAVAIGGIYGGFEGAHFGFASVEWGGSFHPNSYEFVFDHTIDPARAIAIVVPMPSTTPVKFICTIGEDKVSISTWVVGSGLNPIACDLQVIILGL